MAIDMNRARSGLVSQPHPSAMFAVTDAAARRICDVSPYRSAAGNFSVAAYSSRTNEWALFQTASFLKSCTLESVVGVPEDVYPLGRTLDAF